MTKWVEDCKVMYLESLLSGAKKHSKGGNFSERGLKALYKLSQERGPDAYVPVKEIRRVAGFAAHQTTHAGLWDWLNISGAVKKPNARLGAGIVERAGSPRAYRIRKEFYQAVGKVLGQRCLAEMANLLH